MFFFFLLFLFFLFRHLELVACFYLNIVSELSLLTVALAEPPAAGTQYSSLPPDPARLSGVPATGVSLAAERCQLLRKAVN